MEEGIGMMNLHVSVVTIDKRLQIARADKEFYEYIGFENRVSLINAIHPDDLEFFKEKVKNLFEWESAVLVIRLKRQGGEYQYMLTKLSGLVPKEGAEPYVEVRMQNVSDLEQDIGKIRDEDSICNEFLDFFGGYLFRYDTAQDFFRIFNGGERNRIYAFRGMLKEFRQTMLQNGCVGEVYRNDFENFCGDIASGTKNFEYKLPLVDSSGGAPKDIYIVRGRTIQNTGREPVVIGCIYRQGVPGGKSPYAQGEFEKDVTTGLLTKKAIVEYAENLLRRKPKYNVNLCVVDIDNFKQVNDTLGHLYGDQVLAQIADILKEAVAGKGLVGRIGGDEMFIVLEGVHTLDNLRGILRSIRSNVEWAYKAREGVPGVTCSIGVSTYPGDAKNYDDLFKIADKMLYRAKEKGKNRYIVYAADVHGDVLSEGEGVVPIKGEGQRQEREELVLKMLECLAKQQNQPYGTMLQSIGTTFGLDEIQMLYADGEKVLLEGCWNAKEGTHTTQSLAACIKEENFIHLYGERNIAVIDRTSLIEEICPKTYRYLTDHNVKAALIYKMHFAHHQGYIAYYKKSDLSRKWSESDKENLTYVSKAVELLLNDK